MRSEFTGRKMALVMIAGFGVIIAVNLVMASIATRSFSGVVVENSYVASQKFNGWLEEAERQKTLGWSAVAAREGDRLALDTRNVPQAARISAQARRPLGQPDTRVFTFAQAGEGHHLSTARLPPGRWIVRVSIEAGPDRWSREDELR